MNEKTNINIIFFRCLAKLIDLFIVITIWKLIPSAGLFIGIFYLLISDGIFKGKSIGKKFLRLRVVNLERQSHADFRDSIVRNLSLGLPLLFLTIPIIGWLLYGAVLIFELILIIGDSEGKRLGDHLANTGIMEE